MNFDVLYNDLIIEKQYNRIDKKLIEYVSNNIIDEYKLNDKGHDINHINYVLKRALEISDNYDVDLNMLYISVMFHDIACHIDRERHEILSAEILRNDIFLNYYFDNIEVICEAIEDHRASKTSKPRNIYGCILSSADRKVDVKEYLKSSLGFYLKKNKNKDECIEDSYNFAIKKFGPNGYAVDKNYVNDDKYNTYLKNLNYLIDHKELYIKMASDVFENLK